METLISFIQYVLGIIRIIIAAVKGHLAEKENCESESKVMKDISVMMPKQSISLLHKEILNKRMYSVDYIYFKTKLPAGCKPIWSIRSPVIWHARERILDTS